MIHTEVAGTRVRLKVRRRCTGCPRVLVGRGPAKCAACRERDAAAARVGRRLCCECGDPVKGRRHRCDPCRKERQLDVLDKYNRSPKGRANAARKPALKKAWHARHPDKARHYVRTYYARQRAKGWRDPTLKARLRKLRDKTRKRAYVPRRSPAVMRALRGS